VSFCHIVRLAVCCTGLLIAAESAAGPVNPAPPLPPPTGRVVRVSTEPELQAAVRGLTSNTTILVRPGSYRLTNTLQIAGTLTNVGIRGDSPDRDRVVLVGSGVNDDTIQFGIWTGGNIRGVTIANLTIRDVYYHPIILNPGTHAPLIHNVHLINAGQQFIKGNQTAEAGGVDDGVVEYSVIEYETTSKDNYTNGIDIHRGANWIIRHNLFRNIRPPAGQLAGPAILMWNRSSNTLTEGNTFINCQRDIAYGLNVRAPHDHTGGIIRNNFIYRDASFAGGDVGIGVSDSPGTRVLNNTVLIGGAYPNAIEYRFPGTTGVVVANNLTDKAITARNGASAELITNCTSATADLFVNPGVADLHLRATAAVAIDRGTRLDDAATDWDGDARPQGTAADIGADEYRGHATADAARLPQRRGSG
jgi:Right handed beta helix region